MFKKTLLVGIATLGLSAAVFASGECPVAPVVEFNPGIYLGIQAGYGLTGWDHFVRGTDESITVDNEDGFAGRIFIGYDFHPNFAVELGWMGFSNKVHIYDTFDGTKLRLADVRTQAVDLLAKLKIPFNDVFGIYTKVGLGYLISNKLQDADAPIVANKAFLFADDSFERFDVAYGLGFNYNFTPNVGMDLSWMQYNGRSDLEVNSLGQLTEYQPDADLFLLGVYYKFDL